MSESGSLESLPVRAYLDQTVSPVLLEGLALLAKERPADPCAWLAQYLLDHNPKNPALRQ